MAEARTLLGVGSRTYVKFAPYASAQRTLQAMPTLAQTVFTGTPKGWAVALDLVRMDRLDAQTALLNPGFSSRLLMLAIGGIRHSLHRRHQLRQPAHRAFGSRRAKEVGVRKLAGALRRVLMMQFLAESIAYVIAASLVAVALVELLLPYANDFLIAGAKFRYWQDPALLGALALLTLLLGTLAGAYPALVLSAIRPLRVLSGEMRHSRGAGVVRQIFVTGQFSILIGLVIAAAVVYQQRRFATQAALRIDADQVLLIRSPCNTAFTSQVRMLPGVRGLACSSTFLVDHGGVNVMLVNDRRGAPQLLYPIFVDPTLLELYGIKPVVGRNPASTEGTYYLLNETAARQLGFVQDFQMPSATSCRRMVIARCRSSAWSRISRWTPWSIRSKLRGSSSQPRIRSSISSASS